MTELRIIDETGRIAEERLTDIGAIADRLAAVGSRFERIALPETELDPDANQDEVIEAYRESLDALMQRYEFATVDVVALSPQHPRAARRRDELQCEHRHQVAEGRLVVNGCVTFCLRAHGKVHALLCRRGDFIGLPAETGHWLDAGNPPDFRSIRLFTATAECAALPPEQIDPARLAVAAGSGLEVG